MEKQEQETDQEGRTDLPPCHEHARRARNRSEGHVHPDDVHRCAFPALRWPGRRVVAGFASFSSVQQCQQLRRGAAVL